MTVAGIPLRIFSGPDFPTKMAVNRTYIDALEAAGAVVLPIPVIGDASRVRPLYDSLDALLLPGGADVEPWRYGAAARADAGLYTMPELDAVEFQFLEWALGDGMPVLAICRGIQVLNVACGGTLWQDINVEGATTRPHDCMPRDSLVHDLEVEPASLLARTMGETHVAVNSLHHQAIRAVGPSLRAVARTEDGLIEGVEMPDRPFVVGIQCHPEELVGKADWARRLFRGLVAAGADYAAVRSRDQMHPERPGREPAARPGSQRR